ncbi:hypothetical protein [Streptomyces sp. NPDC058394]|uniref:hypothetical protein n=1 Tax=unclassified Streptomyces TaxID=2593676 RepID=UPI0036529731
MAETGKTVPSAKPDEVMAIGPLANGALFSVQLEGGQKFLKSVTMDLWERRRSWGSI